MPKILITGGSGLIGTNAVEYFCNKGFEVLNYDFRSPQNLQFEKNWVEGDINDYEKYFQITNEFQPDFFLHLAARTDLLESRDLINGYKSNIEGVKNTIKVVNEVASIRRVLFASSRLVCRIDYLPKNYDDYCPPNLYGESKVMGEKIVKESVINKEWLIFRPTSIWGPWFDSPYIIFFKTIEKNLYFNPGNYNPRKSFGFVKNSIYQLDKLMHAPKEMIDKKSFYLCDYPPLTLKEWSTYIRNELNSKKIPTYPVFVLRGAAFFGDIFQKFGWNRVPITTFRLNNLITDMVYDTSELQNICGALPYDLETGVKETVEWMKHHKNRDKLALVK
ncbi:MAG: NAD(P)-dependent oxidoreductase [Bacteroidetes bacterium]|mgnify:CR=1 FL=1|nr:NAD(P)-dependent oxidoreductase [Bacteroidota bacterium]